MKIYLVQQCPVCLGSSDLILLLDRASNQPIFYCNGCASAWDSQPEVENVDLDKIRRLEKIAPNGVVNPTTQDVERLGIECRISEESYNSIEDVL